MAIQQVEGREREYDDWWDPYNPNQPVTTPPAVTPPPPPTTQPTPTTTQDPWTNPNARPTAPILPGWEYYWQGAPDNRWGTRQIGGTTNPTGRGPYGGEGMGDFTSGSYLPEGWGWPSYTQPEYADPGPFDPGPAFTYKDFAPPTGETMLNEPGFQFRLDQGRKALEASAAGRGVLRSGGTLKDILGYGQNFASQEFGNVFNRAAQEYDMNRSNAFDTWQTGYGGRKDAYGFKADNFGQKNLFNQRNSEFDFTGRQR